MKLRLIAGSAALMLVAAISVPALAEEESENPVDSKALSILEEMSDYLKSAKELTFRGDARFELVATDGQKIEYGEQISVAVKRPRRIRASLDGDIAAREFWFDGKRAALFDPDTAIYATANVSGDIDKGLRTLANDYGMSAPLADFVLNDPYDALEEGLDSARYVGLGLVGDTLCHHLAFRHDGAVDWQLWVDAGYTRAPRRLVIVYVNRPGAPEYRVDLHDWDFAAKLPDSAFVFEAQDGSRQIDFAQATGSHRE